MATDPLEEMRELTAQIRDAVRDVYYHHRTGLYIYGPPGITKTHTVMETLRELDPDAQAVSGHLDPQGPRVADSVSTPLLSLTVVCSTFPK